MHGIVQSQPLMWICQRRESSQIIEDQRRSHLLFLTSLSYLEFISRSDHIFLLLLSVISFVMLLIIR